MLLKADSSSLIKLATIVSTVGHPLLMMALASVLIAFHLYDPPKAALIAGVVVTLVIVPVTIHNIVRTRQKVYTNFDVSDQRQRNSFYRFGLSVLTLGTIVLYFIPGANDFFVGTAVALVMLATSAIVNLKIKASLHTSTIVFISIICIDISFAIGIAFLVFSFAVAASRLVLKRHTLTEVVLGGAIGFVFGLVPQFLL